MVSKRIPLLSPGKPPQREHLAVEAGKRAPPDKAREANISAIKSELASDSVNLMRLGELITQDPDLTAHLLTVANSSYFGLRRRIEAVKDAVLVLGLDATRRCVMEIDHLDNHSPVAANHPNTSPTTEDQVDSPWSVLFGQNPTRPTFVDSRPTGFPDTVPMSRDMKKGPS